MLAVLAHDLEVPGFIPETSKFCSIEPAIQGFSELRKITEEKIIINLATHATSKGLISVISGQTISTNGR